MEKKKLWEVCVSILLAGYPWSCCALGCPFHREMCKGLWRTLFSWSGGADKGIPGKRIKHLSGTFLTFSKIPGQMCCLPRGLWRYRVWIWGLKSGVQPCIPVPTLPFPPASLPTALQSTTHHRLTCYWKIRAASFSAPSWVLRLETMPPAALNTLLSHYNNTLKPQSF